MTPEETLALEELLQHRIPIVNAKLTPKSVGFPASLSSYDPDGVLVRQALVSRALRKYVPVTTGIACL